ncbi:MAG: hypothetical protein VX246_15455 [Myxococcota bacterium]|nr:hypothetical protein [Myxococcota bacterium]
MFHRYRTHRLIGVALTAHLALSTAAFAEEVIFAVEAQGEYNSNILATDTDQVGSFLTRIGPVVTITDREGRLKQRTVYRGEFVWWADATNLDSYEQYLNADVTYQLGKRTSVEVRDAFYDRTTVRFSEAELEDLADTLDGGVDPYVRNLFDVRLTHQFSRRVSGRVDFNHELLDYKGNVSNVDSSFMGGAASLSYAVTRQDTIGIGGAFSYQSYEATGSFLGSRGRTWNGFLSWVHRFENDLKLNIQGGPTYVTTVGSRKAVALQSFQEPIPGSPFSSGLAFPCTDEADPVNHPGVFLETSCSPVLVVGSNPVVRLPIVGTSHIDHSITFFARAGLTKGWENWTLSANFVRRQSGASGDSGTSALNRALVTLEYDADRDWSFYASAVWSRRKRFGAPIRHVDYLVVPDSGGVTQRVAKLTEYGKNRSANDQYSLILGTKRRLTKHLYTEVTFSYRNQVLEKQVASTRNTEFFVVGASLDYDFDPIWF